MNLVPGEVEHGEVFAESVGVVGCFLLRRETAYVVRGKGNAASLNSAAHGAGRVMSRKAALSKLNWKDAKQLLIDRGVRLLWAGIDEVPFVFKDIDKVMTAQADLVEPVARFFPRLVRMAPAGERAEDREQFLWFVVSFSPDSDTG